MAYSTLVYTHIHILSCAAPRGIVHLALRGVAPVVLLGTGIVS